MSGLLWGECSSLSFNWCTVSIGEGRVQRGSPDVCCIVEYGVCMLICCVDQKEIAKKQILNHGLNHFLFTFVQIKAFQNTLLHICTMICIHPASTATVHVIYTLCCPSVLKYLCIPKCSYLLHVTLLYNRNDAQKAGANWKKWV